MTAGLVRNDRPTRFGRHVVGSNNGLQPWTGIGLTTLIIPQMREQQERMANAIAVVRSGFARARTHRDRAVVILQQADLFDPIYTPTPDDGSSSNVEWLRMTINPREPRSAA